MLELFAQEVVQHIDTLLSSHFLEIESLNNIKHDNQCGSDYPLQIFCKVDK